METAENPFAQQSDGHRTEISICDRFAISFAVDHLDRHIKILDITLADTPR